MACLSNALRVVISWPKCWKMHQTLQISKISGGGACPWTPLVPRGLQPLASPQLPTFVFQPPTSKLVETPDKWVKQWYLMVPTSPLNTGRIVWPLSFFFIFSNSQNKISILFLFYFCKIHVGFVVNQLLKKSGLMIIEELSAKTA